MSAGSANAKISIEVGYINTVDYRLIMQLFARRIE
jgi:hypothetical protein